MSVKVVIKSDLKGDLVDHIGEVKTWLHLERAIWKDSDPVDDLVVRVLETVRFCAAAVDSILSGVLIANVVNRWPHTE